MKNLLFTITGLLLLNSTNAFAALEMQQYQRTIDVTDTGGGGVTSSSSGGTTVHTTSGGSSTSNTCSSTIMTNVGTFSTLSACSSACSGTCGTCTSMVLQNIIVVKEVVDQAFNLLINLQ